MDKINIYLSEKQLEELRKLSEETGIPYSEHIRRAIDEYLVRVFQRVRERNSMLENKEWTYKKPEYFERIDIMELIKKRAENGQF